MWKVRLNVRSVTEASFELLQTCKSTAYLMVDCVELDDVFKNNQNYSNLVYYSVISDKTCIYSYKPESK